MIAAAAGARVIPRRPCVGTDNEAQTTQGDGADTGGTGFSKASFGHPRAYDGLEPFAANPA